MALRDFLRNIADAIRKKNGTTAEINAQDFAKQIGLTSEKAKVMINPTYVPKEPITIEGDDFAGITKLEAYQFCYRDYIDKIIIPDLDENGNGVTALNTRCFGTLWSKNYNSSAFPPNKQIIVGNGVTAISDQCFFYSSGVKYIEFRGDIKSIGSSAFTNAPANQGGAPEGIIKMVNCTSVPTLASAGMFSSTKVGTRIIVPDNLYDEWINATNWNAISTNVTIVKNSDYEASLTEVAE